MRGKPWQIILLQCTLGVPVWPTQVSSSSSRGRGADLQYASKMDEFEMFVSRAKYPALSILATTSMAAESAMTAPHLRLAPSRTEYAPPSSSSLAAAAATTTVNTKPRPKLLLIDDVPHVTDAESRRRMSAALRDLVLTARGPVRSWING